MTPEERLLWEANETLSARIQRLERLHAAELQNIDWRAEK